MAILPNEREAIGPAVLARRPWLGHYEPGVPAFLDYPPVPVHAFLEATAARLPNQPATIFYGAQLSYRQVSILVNKLAAALQRLGIRKGDRVALYLPNTPQFVISFFAALKIGAVVTAINPLNVDREVAQQLYDSGAETVIVLSRFLHIVQGVRDQTKLRNVVVTNIKEYFPPLLRFLFTYLKEKKDGDRVDVKRAANVIPFQDLLRGSHEPTPVNVAPGDVALLQYTGGTTGRPKAAILTHANLVANAVQAQACFPGLRNGGERFMGVVPFFHSYGMTLVVVTATLTANAVIVVPRFDLKDVLKTINKQHPTLFHGVPTMYIAINNARDVAKYNVRSIRACISGAAPLPLEVAEQFERLTGGRLVEGYGLSEAAPLTHVNPIFGERREGSIGLPVPDVEAKIVDMETGMRDMPVGEAGELILRGPQVMQGYWNRPEDTAQALRDGWLFTGDIAKMDADGYFYIVDRKKDLIIAGGFNIYPREIEEVLYEHPKVKEAVAVGVPDPYRGETVKVFVVPKEGEQLSCQEVIDFCRAKLAKYKVPSAVEFRDQLPKTLVGKVLRRVLLEDELKKSTSR